MNEPGKTLESRVLALEGRVLALEKIAVTMPEKNRRASLARDESHLNTRLELLSLLEDHIEVLKLIHSTVVPTDRGKNKLVLNYIRRAESTLDQFQARIAQVEEVHKDRENGAVQNPVPRSAKPRSTPLPKPSALDRLLRSVALWNM